MSGHTPGPWRLLGRELYGSDGSRIAEDIKTIDARLIAEAPEMLAALRRAVLALAFVVENLPGMHDDYIAVSTAIAKATGGAA